MEFKWLNESTVKQSEDRLRLWRRERRISSAAAWTSVRRASSRSPCATPPITTRRWKGDFVLRVKVSHGFQDTYDSASVMVMKDLNCWAKCCFELTDFGTHRCRKRGDKRGFR